MEDKKVSPNIFSRVFNLFKSKFDSRTIHNAKYYQDWNKIKWKYRTYKVLYLSLSFAAFQFLIYLKPKEKFESEFNTLNSEIEKYFNIKETKVPFHQNFNMLKQVNGVFFQLNLLEKSNENKEVKFLLNIFEHLLRCNTNINMDINQNLEIMKVEKNPNFSQEQDDLTDNLYNQVK